LLQTGLRLHAEKTEREAQGHSANQQPQFRSLPVMDGILAGDVTNARAARFRRTCSVLRAEGRSGADLAALRERVMRSPARNASASMVMVGWPRPEVTKLLRRKGKDS